MKVLTLIRHASAASPAAGSDWDRPLAPGGERDATEMAQRLAERATPDLFVSSSARRAVDTATIVARGVGYDPAGIERRDGLYEAAVPDVVQVLRGLDDDHASVVVCGHNPVTAELIQYLTLDSPGRIPPGTVARLELSIESWTALEAGCATLSSLDSPGAATAE